MIVVCSACQARFKVADDKVGPRGAKVRCSKCQTVFVVHRDPAGGAGASPAPARPSGAGLDLDLEGAPRGGHSLNGFAADPFGLGAPTQPAADPFGQAEAAPYAPPDPFGGGSAGAPNPFAPPDPFGPSSGMGGFGAVDPFVATVAGGGQGLPNSAVTDLSDLLGGGRGTASPPRGGGGARDVAPPPEPSGILEDGFDFDQGDGAAPDAHAGAFEPSLADPTGVHEYAPAPEPDLALAERTPARPLSSAPMTGFGDFGADDPFPDSGGGFGFGGGGNEPFGATTHEAAPAPPVAQHEAAQARPPPAAPPAAKDQAEDQQAVVETRRRASRVRAIAVNAISLAALLVVAVAFLAYWRGVRPGVGELLRPSAVLGGLGVAPASFATTEVRSGLYERADAPPVLFVAGTAVSHASAAVPGLRVRVEVVRKGSVLARGEARAGAVPTAEELYASRDAAGLAAVIARHASPERADVKPGQGVPFLVAISDYPADAVGAGLQVTVEPIDAPVAR